MAAARNRPEVANDSLTGAQILESSLGIYEVTGPRRTRRLRHRCWVSS